MTIEAAVNQELDRRYAARFREDLRSVRANVDALKVRLQFMCSDYEGHEAKSVADDVDDECVAALIDIAQALERHAAKLDHIG